MGKYNLHTHTYRCNHASGDVPELVEAARESGYTTLGISEHTILNDGKFPGMRLTYENVDEYFSIIEKCRAAELQKPGGIRILSGLECEPLEEYFNFYKETKEKYNVDYLIESNHFFPYKSEYITAGDDRYDIQKKIKIYTDILIKGMATGLFIYIAHPDMFMAAKERWDSYTAGVIKELMQASKQYKTALEINLNGYRKGMVRRGLNLRYQYPVEEFWELAASENVEVVIGVDAHSPRNFGMQYPALTEMLNRYKLNILSEDDIIERIACNSVNR